MRSRRPLLVLFVFLLLTVPAVAQEAGTGAAGPVHMVLELGQILFAATALIGLILAFQRLEGGVLAQSVTLLGTGVLLIVMERLWHSFGKLDLFLAQPAIISNSFFLLALLLFTAGFVHIYWTLR